MKPIPIMLCVSAIALAAPAIGQADDDFFGIVESRPAGIAGTWTVGGRSFAADDRTRLDEDDGPARVGACVSVDYEGPRVEEIETEPAARCRAR